MNLNEFFDSGNVKIFASIPLEWRKSMEGRGGNENGLHIAANGEFNGEFFNGETKNHGRKKK